jgi:UDP-N-acetylmuramoyl-tripeptide--D-alanyl-D-alanine ligase
MFGNIKKYLYFAVAWYFRFFAAIKLKRWHPRVVVVTGSSGKTTLLHLIEAQFGKTAKYSHHANSSIGIPFDILGLHRTKLTLDEWPYLFVSAMFFAFSKVPDEKIYIAECDCDRPYEAKFLGELLRPEVTIWTNVSRTHSMNFDNLVDRKKFKYVEEVIAYEFGYLPVKTKELVILNADDELELSQISRIVCQIEKVSALKDLTKYLVGFDGTEYILNGTRFKFPFLFPKEIATSILMCKKLVEYFDIKFDKNFSGLSIPPGRNSVFKGVKNITIVDSAYNASLRSMKAILDMFSQIDSKNKWVVLGDMLEQGNEEKEEHEKLAEIISKQSLKRIILIGPRISRYTFPILKKEVQDNAILEKFLTPKEVLDYLNNNLIGEEVVLFKGARFLEGVIENLLLNKSDASKLDRREKVWEIRRKKWGL